MTLIEFFDSEMLENILATLILKPERTIFFGKDKRKMEKFIFRMQQILKEKNICADCSVISVNTKDFYAVREMLFSLSHQYDDCVFDMLGGDETVLTAMGAVANEKNIPLCSIHPRSNKLRHILPQGTCSDSAFSVSLSASQTVRLFGGTIMEFQTARDQNILLPLWDICKKNCARWNTAVESLAKYLPDSQENCMSSAIQIPTESLSSSAYRTRNMLSVLKEMNRCKMATVSGDASQTTYTFSSSEILRFLEKSGNVLEYYTLHAVSKLPGICDAVSGAVIDWENPPDDQDEDDVKNEIDVLAVYGSAPIFISCKNGCVDSDELYKLDTVAKRFGGKYAKKILVMTYFDVPDAFIRRAHAMNIHLIRNVQDITMEEFSKKLKDYIK